MSANAIVPTVTSSQDATTAVPLDVTLAVPTVATSSTDRKLAYISSKTASISGKVLRNGSVVSSDTQNCSRSCKLKLSAVPGNVTVSLSLYAGANASGEVLSTGTAVSTITSGQNNSISVALSGVVSSIGLMLASSGYTIGTPRTDALMVTAYDGSGAQIIGNTQFATPITVTMTGDAAKEFQLTQTSLTGPSATGIPLVFNGGSTIETANIKATAGSTVTAAVPLTLTVALPGSTTQSSGFVSESPVSADAFVDSIGVNTHLIFDQTAYYTNYPTLRTLLLASGIRHIRDGLVDTTDPNYYSRLNDLGAGGVKATLITSLGQSAALITGYPQKLPGVIEAIEGPNEYDLSNDPNWNTKLVQFQQFLYQTVKANPSTAQLPVIAPALTSAQAYASLGNISAYADEGNMHDYFEGYNPGTSGWGDNGYGSIAYNQTVARQASASKPIISTETGYCTYNGLKNAVTPTIQGIYEPRMFLEQFMAGVPRTFGYEFLDEGTGDCFGNYGLTTSNLTPKPAYTSLTNMIALLSDKGASFTPSAIQYQLAGNLTGVHHLLLGKRDGTDILAIWSEVPSWNVNAGNGAVVSVAAQSVTLTLPTAPKTSKLQTFDDQGNLAAGSLNFSGATTTLPVSDHVTFVTFHE